MRVPSDPNARCCNNNLSGISGIIKVELQGWAPFRDRGRSFHVLYHFEGSCFAARGFLENSTDGDAYGTMKIEHHIKRCVCSLSLLPTDERRSCPKTPQRAFYLH